MENFTTEEIKILKKIVKDYLKKNDKKAVSYSKSTKNRKRNFNKLEKVIKEIPHISNATLMNKFKIGKTEWYRNYNSKVKEFRKKYKK